MPIEGRKLLGLGLIVGSSESTTELLPKSHYIYCAPACRSSAYRRMQKERTLRFWDDYHSSNVDKEWILHPSADLLESLAQQIPAWRDNNRTIRILEVGCGTSSLARDLWLYMRSQRTDISIQVCATDVSEVSLSLCRERDKEWLNNNDNDDESSSRLQYSCLNVLLANDDSPPFPLSSWDLILDKGCLDTLLFRSPRQRGESRDYPHCLATLLGNVWMWLKLDQGVYVVLSPRKKLKALRAFAGFASVVRAPLTSPQQAELVLRGEKKSQKGPDNSSTRNPRQCTHAWVCHKNTNFEPGMDDCWNTSDDSLPDDDSICPSCHISFDAFRKQQPSNQERPTTFWCRVWKRHQVHCKVSTNDAR